jgi:hypothetical protein
MKSVAQHSPYYLCGSSCGRPPCYHTHRRSSNGCSSPHTRRSRMQVVSEIEVRMLNGSSASHVGGEMSCLVRDGGSQFS